MKKYYSYPCEQADDCIDFLEGAKNIRRLKSFAKRSVETARTV